MKILILIIAVGVFSACHASTSQSEGALAQTTQTVNTSTAYNASPTPNNVSTSQNESEAQNEKFKIAPKDFKQIDFKNHSYPYKFSYDRKRKLNIILRDGKYEYDFNNGPGWFDLSDVYYVDLTNDGKAEAIVMLWHVSCGVSCDGGAGLFYIYTVHQNKLKPIWQFETGSMKYGCGLKSFVVKNRKITMELFRKCSNVRDESGATFRAENITGFTFVFNGGKIVEEKREFISAPERDTRNYHPEISISE